MSQVHSRAVALELRRVPRTPLFIESFDIFLHFNTLSLNVFFSVPLLTLIIGALSFLVSALLHQIPFVKKYFV